MFGLLTASVMALCASARQSVRTSLEPARRLADAARAAEVAGCTDSGSSRREPRTCSQCRASTSYAGSPMSSTSSLRRLL